MIFQLLSKVSSKDLLILLVVTMLGTSFLTGCDTKEDLTNDQENLTDKLYKNKTEFIGDNSKVSGLVSSLEYPKGYEYDYIEIVAEDEDDDQRDNQLSILFKEDNNRNSKYAHENEFVTQSAILFSLIGNLDHIEYISQEEDGQTAFAGFERDQIERYASSALGIKTEEIGSSKANFKKLVELYEARLESETDPVPSKPIEKEEPTGELELDEIINSLSGVKMVADGATITPEGMSVEFINNTNLEYIFSEDFLIQKKVSKVWEDVEPIIKEGQYAFHDIALILPANKSNDWAVDWKWLYGSLDKGSYRIVKQVIRNRKPGETDLYYLGAEFEIK